MKRWLFNFAAVISLLLCLGMIILWIACHGKLGSKPVQIPATGGRYAIVLWDGYMALSRVDRTASAYPYGQLYVLNTWLGPARVAFWIMILIFLPLPSLWLALRRPPVPRGHCQHCGYDLRATPERCPECGAMADGNHSSTIPGSSS